MPIGGNEQDEFSSDLQGSAPLGSRLRGKAEADRVAARPVMLASTLYRVEISALFQKSSASPC